MFEVIYTGFKTLWSLLNVTMFVFIPGGFLLIKDSLKAFYGSADTRRLQLYTELFPAFGFLGTIIGFAKVFGNNERASLSLAIVTTAVGLVLGIISRICIYINERRGNG